MTAYLFPLVERRSLQVSVMIPFSEIVFRKFKSLIVLILSFQILELIDLEIDRIKAQMRFWFRVHSNRGIEMKPISRNTKQIK